MSSDAQLAWALADSAADFFSVDENALVYVALGAGETLLAIRHVLEIAVHKAQPLPAALVGRVARRLDCYIGSQHEPAVRRLLTDIGSAVPAAHSGRHADGGSEPVVAPLPTAGWVQISDVNPQVIARHSPPITCPTAQVAASVREWFPDAGAAVRDTIDALQRTLSAGGCVDRPASLLNIAVAPISDDTAAGR